MSKGSVWDIISQVGELNNDGDFLLCQMAETVEVNHNLVDFCLLV